MERKFIIDTNVGKLAKWLRMMGYDTLLFNEQDDGKMVKIALSQARLIITRDSEFMKRRAITKGRVKAFLVTEDKPELQMQTVINALQLEKECKPFTRCLECNSQLTNRERGEIKPAVPPRVFEMQDQYMECPSCHRIFWRGTHWQSMNNKLRDFISSQPRNTKGERI